MRRVGLPRDVSEGELLLPVGRDGAVLPWLALTAILLLLLLILLVGRMGRAREMMLLLLVMTLMAWVR